MDVLASSSGTGGDTGECFVRVSTVDEWMRVSERARIDGSEITRNKLSAWDSVEAPAGGFVGLNGIS